MTTRCGVFVPYTKGGCLRTKLAELEDRLGFQRKYKYVEKAGASLESTMVTKDPWSTYCGREICFPCMGEEKNRGKCMKQGILYVIDCLTCKEENKVTQYWGESGRSGFDRGQEHLMGLRNKSSNSCLWNHHQETHGVTSEPSFQMKVHKSYPSNLSRQVAEGIKINHFKGDMQLNSRGEWGQNLAPNLVLEEDAWEKGKKRIGDRKSGDQSFQGGHAAEL